MPSRKLSPDFLKLFKPPQKKNTKVKTVFSYGTLLWIRQHLKSSTKISSPPDNPVEVICACSYFLLRPLAWRVYVRYAVPDDTLLSALDRVTTLIPPVHISHRLRSSGTGLVVLDLLTTDGRWLHYEEGVGFVFQRRVGPRSFAKLRPYTFYARGHICDTYRMKIRRVPDILAKMLCVKYSEEGKLYFIQKDEARDVTVLTWDLNHPTEVTWYFSHGDHPRVIDEGRRIYFDPDGCQRIIIPGDNDSIILIKKKVYPDELRIAYAILLPDDSIRYETHYRFNDYECPVATIWRAARHPTVYMVDNWIRTEGPPVRKVGDNTIRALYALREQDFLREWDRGYHYLENTMRSHEFLERGQRVRTLNGYCRAYKFQDTTIKALYRDVRDNLIGVYQEEEQLYFYSMYKREDTLERGPLVRCVPDFNLPWAKIRRVYSEDAAQEPWMLGQPPRRPLERRKRKEKKEIWPHYNKIWIWKEEE